MCRELLLNLCALVADLASQILLGIFQLVRVQSHLRRRDRRIIAHRDHGRVLVGGGRPLANRRFVRSGGCFYLLSILRYCCLEIRDAPRQCLCLRTHRPLLWHRQPQRRSKCLIGLVVCQPFRVTGKLSLLGRDG